MPQGSILGPLFFIIFINDLPRYLSNVLSKLFADDTTLITSDENLQALNVKLVKCLELLDEWCKHNRLYINWDKTFIMYITNKRIQLPTEFKVSSTRTIKVVEKFKLLGVTLDNRLKFDQFVYDQVKSINKKLYSIRRLFYLPFEVKLLFFKAFILPCFDYCISLSLYFNRYLLEKLGRMFYLTLVKLLRFRFENDSITEINRFLEGYGLQAFQYRVISRSLSFLNKLACDQNAPIGLKSEITRIIRVNDNYELRSNNKLVLEPIVVRSKFGDLIFKNICSKIVNKLNYIDFYGDQKMFKSQLYIFQDEIVSIFTSKFVNFNLNLLNIKFYR